MFCGAQKHSKDWKAASKWKLCDVRGIRAAGAGLSIARVKVLRVEGDVRCAELVDLVAHRRIGERSRMPRTWSRTLES